MFGHKYVKKKACFFYKKSVKFNKKWSKVERSGLKWWQKTGRNEVGLPIDPLLSHPWLEVGEVLCSWVRMITALMRREE